MIKEVLIVRPEDGLVFGTAFLDDPDAGPIVPHGEPPIAGCEFVDLAGRFSREGRRDTEHAYLRGGVIEWVETATLEDLRAVRNTAINAWKLEANNSYFDFAGKQIAYKESDRVEIQAINNVVLLTGAMPDHPDWPAAWKAIDNTWVPLPDVAAWTAFNLAIAERGTAHFKRAQELKGELARAMTPAEIEAITW